MPLKTGKCEDARAINRPFAALDTMVIAVASSAAFSASADALLESFPGQRMPDDPVTQQSNRNQAEDHYYAALDLVAEGQHDKAVAEYRKSLAADPNFTDALHGLSRALQDLNRLDEAIEVSNRIAELDPDDVLAHTSLSILYQKKGMVPEAEAEGNKARVLGWKQQLKKGSV